MHDREDDTNTLDLIGLGFYAILIKLENLERKVQNLQRNERHIFMDLQQILDKVGADTTVDQSAITLLNELSTLVKANINNPAQLQAIADSLDANSASMAAAVLANTPEATAPPVA